MRNGLGLRARWPVAAIAAAAAIVIAGGCGRRPPPMVVAEGSVTLDGRPLATTAHKNVAIAAAVPPHAAGRLAIAYRPAGFTLGLPIAIAAALLTLLAAAAARRR